MTVEDLTTPALLIDEDRLMSNVRRMAERAETAGVALRPHTKTHKSVAIARRQIEAGASGITVAKIGEAEVFASAGFEDIRIAYPVVGADRYERVAGLAKKSRISFTVDTEAGARGAAEWFSAAGLSVDVLVEIDTGHGRCGARWDDEEVVRLALLVEELPGVRMAGILTHAGHSYAGPGPSELHEDRLRRISAQERDRMLDAAARIRAAGVDPGDISIGSTPTATFFEPREHDGLSITEIRPGNYVFLDMIQVNLKAAELPDCALTVVATVVSKRRDRDGTERVFLDAGGKVLTSDKGYGCEGFGQILYNTRTMTPLPHAELAGLSEEHGWVRVGGGATLEIGDRVFIVPNHACVAVNTQDRMHLVRDGEVVETLDVDARGRVR